MKLSLLYVGSSIALASATVAPKVALWNHPNHNVERQVVPTLSLPLSLSSAIGNTTFAPTPGPISLTSSTASVASNSTSASSASITSSASVPLNSTSASSTVSLTSSSLSASNSSSSASSVSSTATSTSAAPSVSSSPNIQIFVFVVIEININAKRQAVGVDGGASYILPNGGTTSSCGSAAQWFIQNGELFDVAGGQVGTSPGVASEPFVASANPGSITTTFTDTGNLAWDNAAFTDGTASFCKATDQDGTVIVSFDGPSSPGSVGCTPVRLGITTCPVNNTGGDNGSNNNNNNDSNNNNVINSNNGNNNLVNSGNTINNYNTYNVYNILPGSVINSFNTGAINYYSGDDTFYYAKTCPVCPIVQVYKANDTYAQAACPVCPTEVLQCPGVIHVSTTNQVAPLLGNHSTPASAGVCKYEAPVCVSCETSPVAPPPSMTTVTVPCPSCSSSATTIPCPVSIASSVESVASAKGPAAAQSFAAAANAVTVTASGQSAAPSTVVNVPCTTCPAHSQATVVAQVAAGGSSPGGSSPAGSSPEGSSPAGSSPGGSSPAGSSPAGSSPGGSSPGGSSQPESPAANGGSPAGTAPSSGEAGGSASAANPSTPSSQVASFTGSASTMAISKLMATLTFLLLAAAML